MFGDLLGDSYSPVYTGDHFPVIPGYDILECIGKGGMGTVYRAHQHDPGRDVALKILSPASFHLNEAHPLSDRS